MTRIDQLVKKYPRLPRDVIVQREIIRNGLKDTEDLDTVSVWKRGGGSYQSYDFDLSMKEVATKRAGKMRPGLGLYHKLNKFMYCGFDCASGNAYAGEAGMLALAGDIGKWMADVVPEKANWLARFIESVRSSAEDR